MDQSEVIQEIAVEVRKYMDDWVKAREDRFEITRLELQMQIRAMEAATKTQMEMISLLVNKLGEIASKNY